MRGGRRAELQYLDDSISDLRSQASSARCLVALLAHHSDSICTLRYCAAQRNDVPIREDIFEDVDKIRVKSTIDVQGARKTDSAILCSSVAGAI